MRSTGIVKRIDDLGRIVIPKGLRRTLCIRKSDPIEIFSGREGDNNWFDVIVKRQCKGECYAIPWQNFKECQESLYCTKLLASG